MSEPRWEPEKLRTLPIVWSCTHRHHEHATEEEARACIATIEAALGRKGGPVPEPRYASEEWRWVTSEDGLRRELVAGPEPLPVPRVVLACGDIDAEDMDGIGLLPQMYRELVAAQEYLRQRDAWGELGKGGCKLLQSIRAVLAAARGEGSTDGQ